MDNLNLPPFYVGQKVVALSNSKTGIFKKGQVFTVKGIKKCCTHLVDIGLKVREQHDIQQCCSCYTILSMKGDIRWCAYYCFAPIQEQEFKQTTYSKVLEEVPCCDN